MVEIKKIAIEAAPAAIGPYSQAIQFGSLLFLSGQIALNPKTMELVNGDIEAQTRQVFKNLSTVAEAGNTSLNNAVKLTIYLTNLNDFNQVNSIMAKYFIEPYPARATVEVSALPKGASIEIDAIIAL